MNNAQFSADFFKKLPYKPFCSFGKGGKTLIRSKKHAIQYPLIQVNHIHTVQYLIFDIDAPDAYLHFFDENLPVPTWIAKNKKNGHCHVCYELKTPVCKTAHARLKPLRYLASIEYTYAKKLGADLRYTGLLTKNPIDRDWQVFLLNPVSFELDELADYVDLETKPKSTEEEKKEVSGLGRNCMLFDTIRFWAYKAIRECLGGSLDGWCTKVLNEALIVNGALLDPLPYSEVKATAKSIAKWVWRNHHSAEFDVWFGAKQSNRAKIGVTKGNVSKGGRARSQQYSDMRQEALKLHIMGKSIKEISEYLNVHRNSISNWVKHSKKHLT
ncbi:replication initiation protein [Acinetobacter sp. 256-1]|uniref:replication initiation protein n=1 Tax=Acinetobacter sp. 256-1 TaxID=2746721 RepID=UPI002577B2C0|nr:replication initiation protein [Acinetobacter sp. 256-1]MDM1759227.1 replication initiation protein [Acinetobacter sp. 256-1]